MSQCGPGAERELSQSSSPTIAPLPSACTFFRRSRLAGDRAPLAAEREHHVQQEPQRVEHDGPSEFGESLQAFRDAVDDIKASRAFVQCRPVEIRHNSAARAEARAGSKSAHGLNDVHWKRDGISCLIAGGPSRTLISLDTAWRLPALPEFPVSGVRGQCAARWDRV